MLMVLKGKGHVERGRMNGNAIPVVHSYSMDNKQLTYQHRPARHSHS